jgi:hypothetical protein
MADSFEVKFPTCGKQRRFVGWGSEIPRFRLAGVGPFSSAFDPSGLKNKFETRPDFKTCFLEPLGHLATHILVHPNGPGISKLMGAPSRAPSPLPAAPTKSSVRHNDQIIHGKRGEST